MENTMEILETNNGDNVKWAIHLDKIPIRVSVGARAVSMITNDFCSTHSKLLKFWQKKYLKKVCGFASK